MQVISRSQEEKLHHVEIVFRFRDHRKIILPLSSRKMVLDFDDIIYAESDSSYCKIVTKSSNFIICKTLKWVEEQLDHHFSRIHKSYLINSKEVSSMSPGDQSITMTTGEELPISRAKKKRISLIFE